jgi:hypothetical protein
MTAQQLAARGPTSAGVVSNDLESFGVELNKCWDDYECWLADAAVGWAMDVFQQAWDDYQNDRAAYNTCYNDNVNNNPDEFCADELAQAEHSQDEANQRMAEVFAAALNAQYWCDWWNCDPGVQLANTHET